VGSSGNGRIHKMKKVHILTDSNSHIPAALRQELDIVIVPVTLVWDTTTYLDEIEIGPREFYSRLRKSASIPTTSSPPPGTFKDKIKPLIADGSELLAILTGNEFSSLL
jgi:fatty acid-binding protein DegV